MNKRKENRNGTKPQNKLLLFAAVLVAVVAAILWQNGTLGGETPVAEGVCEAHFADVGQGDCTVFLSDEACMVVDAGPGSAAQSTADYIAGLSRTVDYMVLTHPDEDHIGGATRVLEAVTVKNVIMSDAVKDTGVFTDLLETLEKKETNVIRAVPGDSYAAGGISLSVLAPVGSFEDYDDYNEYSVVCRVEFGANSFLMMGDAERGAEKKLVEKYGDGLSSDVLKLGHHGSSTSTGEELLRAVSPKYAVISCGKNNSYGHPHKETLKALQKFGIDPLRTDRDGTVVLISDGKNISKK